MSTGLLIFALHIAYLLICIAVGLAAFAPHRAKDHRWLMPAFLALLSGFVLFGGGGTIAHWYDMSPVVRFVSVAILGLSLYALYRGVHAQMLLYRDRNNYS